VCCKFVQQYDQAFTFGEQKEKTANVNVHSTAMADVTGKVDKRVNFRLCSKQHSLTECGFSKEKALQIGFPMLNPVVYASTASSRVTFRDAATRREITMWIAVNESTTPCFIQITEAIDEAKGKMLRGKRETVQHR